MQRSLLLTSGLLGLLCAILPEIVAAAAPTVNPCQNMPSGFCQIGEQVNIRNRFVTDMAKFFVGGAAGLSVLFVVWGGFQMIMSLGDESKMTKGRNSVIFALGGFALTLASQTIVTVVVSRFTPLAGSTGPVLLEIQAVLVALMLNAFNVVFVAVAVIAGFRMVISHGKSDEFTKARNTLIFSVIGAFIVNVSKALVAGMLTYGFGG